MLSRLTPRPVHARTYMFCLRAPVTSNLCYGIDAVRGSCSKLANAGSTLSNPLHVTTVQASAWRWRQVEQKSCRYSPAWASHDEDILFLQCASAIWLGCKGGSHQMCNVNTSQFLSRFPPESSFSMLLCP